MGGRKYRLDRQADNTYGQAGWQMTCKQMKRQAGRLKYREANRRADGEND
jgi:hypothetical protein